MNIQTEKLPKNTIKLLITINAADVKGVHENVLANLVTNATVPGFRQGKAPKEKVMEKADMSKVNGEVVNKVLQTYYPQALKEQHITPAGNPRVEIKSFELGKDFVFEATIPLKPEIKLGDFMGEIKKNSQERSKRISEENAEKLKKGEALGEQHDHLHPADVILALVATSKLEIADIMIEEETNRMLARLVEQAEQIGLSLDQYLQAQGKTAEQLRIDYDKLSEQTIKAEFILAQLVKDRGITVSDEEIEQALVASGAQNIEQEMQDNVKKWYIRSILEKNKVITQIIEEAEESSKETK